MDDPRVTNQVDVCGRAQQETTLTLSPSLRYSSCIFFFPLFEMSFVVFCLFHRNIFLLFWYLVFSEKEMPISHITNTLTATCVGSLKRFWSRSPFFFFCSFPFTPPLSSLLFLPPTISVVFSIFSFFIFLSLNSNHLNNESGKTSRGKRCP